jgi:hypothetical protein
MSLANGDPLEPEMVDMCLRIRSNDAWKGVDEWFSGMKRGLNVGSEKEDKEGMCLRCARGNDSS